MASFHSVDPVKTQSRLPFFLIPAMAALLAADPEPAKEKRPEKWARPIVLKGVPNFHQVSTNLPKFIKELDVEEIRKRAGLRDEEAK